MPSLVFDDDKHEYLLDGVRLPHVTGILGQMGLTPRYPVGSYRIRGRRVHEACCLFDAGELDQYEIGADLVPYVERYKSLVLDLKPEYDLTEKALYHPIYCYAGTLDRAGRIFGDRFILDLKSGGTGPETGLQLAAYTLMLHPNDYKTVRRYKLDLSQSNGKLERYDDDEDFEAWLGILSHWRWLQKKKNRPMRTA